MRRLLSRITLFLLSLSVPAQAAMEEGTSAPPAETTGVVWILLGVFIFFLALGYYSWHIIKTERKRQLKDKEPG